MRCGLTVMAVLGIGLLYAQAPPPKSKGAVEKAVDVTVDATKTASQKTAGKTKSAALKTADATKDAALKTADVSKDAALKTADVSKDAAVKTKNAFKPPSTEMIVDINSANQYQLKSLPGIGDPQVAKIIAGRPYKTKSDLVRKKVLPEEAYNRIKDTIVAR
jgi:competence protein ComEA